MESASYLFKHSDAGAVALTRHDAGSTDKPSGQVVHDVAVEIWHHHHIKLVGVRHKLGGGQDKETVEGELMG